MKQELGKWRQEGDDEAANLQAPGAGHFTLIITHHICRAPLPLACWPNLELSPQSASSIREDFLFIVQLAIL